MNVLIGILMLAGLALLAFWQQIFPAPKELELVDSAGNMGWKNELNVPVPNHVPSSVMRWKIHAQKYGEKYGRPWRIILAQIWQESWGDPTEIGSAGEIGLGQLKPIAIKDLRLNGYGSFDGWDEDPEVNIAALAAFLDLQSKRAGSVYTGIKEVKATGLEAYNEGYSEAKKDLGLDEYAEEVIAKYKALELA